MTRDTGILSPSKYGTPPAKHSPGDTILFTRVPTLIAATLLAASVATSAQASLAQNGATFNGTLNGSLNSSFNGFEGRAFDGRVLMIEWPQE